MVKLAGNDADDRRFRGHGTRPSRLRRNFSSLSLTIAEVPHHTGKSACKSPASSFRAMVMTLPQNRVPSFFTCQPSAAEMAFANGSSSKPVLDALMRGKLIVVGIENRCYLPTDNLAALVKSRTCVPLRHTRRQFAPSASNRKSA